MRITVLALLLCACEPITEVDLGDEAVWSGYIVEDPYLSEDLALLADATLSVTGAAANIQAPTNEAPGYWTVTLPANTAVELLVTAENHLPTLRAAVSPVGRAIFTGYLFPWSTETVLPVLDATDITGLVDSTALIDGTAAALWLEPLDPTAWTGASLALSVDGVEVPFVALRSVDGVLTPAGPNDPIQLVLATEIPDGTLSLHVTPTNADGVHQEWTATGGTLIDARYFALPW